MKKMFVPAAALMVMLLLSGCGDKLEVRDKAFVQSAGIVLDNDGYRVALRLFDSSDIYTGSGDTFSDAVNDAEKTQGTDLFTGHTELVTVREDQKLEVLEGLVNEDVSSGCLVVFSDDPVKYTEEMSPDVITGIIGTAVRNGSGSKTDICDVVNGR